MTTENETTGSDQNNNTPSWWIDEGIPGVGEERGRTVNKARP